MAKLLYSATASVDGFIAGTGGDMSWLSKHLGDNHEAAELPDRIGSLLVGRRTFGGDDPNRGTESEGAFGGAWRGPQLVVTHEPPAGPTEDRDDDVTFVTDLAEAIGLAKHAADERRREYVCVLGAELAHGCLELGELDEVLVLYAPVLLGDGVRLFDHPGGAEVLLERVGVAAEASALNAWFRVRRG